MVQLPRSGERGYGLRWNLASLLKEQLMFRGSVRAAGVAALFGACILCSPLARAGDCRSWTPKKSQRETLHPNDCNFGYFGTAWRAWPEDCNRGNEIGRAHV